MKRFILLFVYLLISNNVLASNRSDIDYLITNEIEIYDEYGNRYTIKKKRILEDWDREVMDKL